MRLINVKTKLFLDKYVKKNNGINLMFYFNLLFKNHLYFYGQALKTI